jgi:hypothetical protein
VARNAGRLDVSGGLTAHVAAYQMGRVIRLRKEDLDGYVERARIKPGALRHLYPDTDEPGKADGTESP